MEIFNSDACDGTVAMIAAEQLQGHQSNIKTLSNET